MYNWTGGQMLHQIQAQPLLFTIQGELIRIAVDKIAHRLPGLITWGRTLPAGEELGLASNPLVGEDALHVPFPGDGLFLFIPGGALRSGKAQPCRR